MFNNSGENEKMGENMQFIGFLLIIAISLLLYKKLNFSLLVSIGVAIASLMVIYVLFTMVFVIGAIPVLIGLSLIGIGIFAWLKNEQRKWKNKNGDDLSAAEVANNIESFAVDGDMISDNIPFNRTKYFNMNSEHNYSDDVYPIIYKAAPHKNEMSFIEYGYLITTNEIVEKKRVKNKNAKGKNDKYTFEKVSLPFYGMYKKFYIFNHLIVFYYGNNKPVIFKTKNTLYENVINYVINSGWSRQVQDVLQEGQLIEEIEDIESNINRFEEEYEKAKNLVKQSNLNKNITNAQAQAHMNVNNAELDANQINARFSKSVKNPGFSAKGHGVVGEQAGNMYDRLFFKNANPVGGKIDPTTGRAPKWGEDRIVNGTLIQTKFCKTAKNSIEQAFTNKEAKYINKMTGKMMKIEVPSDQYKDAVRYMEKKIDFGLVPGESNPKNASKYVKKSPLKYEEAQIATTSIFDRPSNSKYTSADNKNKVTTFGQKLVHSAGLDFMTGVSTALPSSIISGVWVYCTCKWNGLDEKQARKQAVIGTIKPIFYSGFTYMIASQFAGSAVGQKIRDKIISTTLAKKFVQQSNKNGTKIVSNGTLMIINIGFTVGPDVYNLLNGRISSKQLIKNTVTTSVGAASGLAVGAAVGSIIPGLGTAVGGMVGSTVGTIVTKKVYDQFVEDDAVTMLKIAKEEFIENVLMAGLTKQEFDEVLQNTFLLKDFNKVLKLMFAADDSRLFIKEIYIDLVTKAYSNRELPDVDEVAKYLNMMFATEESTVA